MPGGWSSGAWANIIFNLPGRSELGRVESITVREVSYMNKPAIKNKRSKETYFFTFRYFKIDKGFVSSFITILDFTSAKCIYNARFESVLVLWCNLIVNRINRCTYFKLMATRLCDIKPDVVIAIFKNWLAGLSDHEAVFLIKKKYKLVLFIRNRF